MQGVTLLSLPRDVERNKKKVMATFNNNLPLFRSMIPLPVFGSWCLLRQIFKDSQQVS